MRATWVIFEHLQAVYLFLRSFYFLPLGKNFSRAFQMDALSKNVRMTTDKLSINIPCDILKVEMPFLLSKSGMHHNLQKANLQVPPALVRNQDYLWPLVIPNTLQPNKW